MHKTNEAKLCRMQPDRLASQVRTCCCLGPRLDLPTIADTMTHLQRSVFRFYEPLNYLDDDTKMHVAEAGRVRRSLRKKK